MLPATAGEGEIVSGEVAVVPGDAELPAGVKPAAAGEVVPVEAGLLVGVKAASLVVELVHVQWPQVFAQKPLGWAALLAVMKGAEHCPNCFCSNSQHQQVLRQHCLLLFALHCVTAILTTTGRN